MPSSPPDALLGRELPLAELSRRFEGGARAVTLVGTGGVGKTSLAAAFAARWPGPSFAATLDDARTPADVVGAIATALDMPEGRWRDTTAALDRVGESLSQSGACLLVVDTLEVAMGAAAEVLEALLERAPRAQLLCTSQQALGQRWEQALPLAPLAPEDAARLFNREARRHLPTFDSERGQEAVRALVSAFDCVPLAVKLAAGLAALLEPGRLLKRLQESPALLLDPDDPGRTGSAERSVAWSWSLLSEGERRALAGCTIFAAPFTADNALAVLAERPSDEPALLANLERLRRKSLLRSETDALGAPRLTPYATVSAYAGARRDAPGVASRHARWCLDEAARLAERPEHEETPARRRLLSPELLAALRGPAARAPLLRARLTLAVRPLYGTLRPMDEGMEALNQALDAALPPELEAELRYARAGLIRRLGFTAEAMADVEIAMRSYPIADKAALLKVRLLLNTRRIDEALALAEGVLARLEERPARSALLEGEALQLLANIRASRGELELAAEHYQRARALFEQAERPNRAAGCLVGIGNLLTTSGRAEEARANYLRALEHLQAPESRAVTLMNLGVTACNDGPPEAGLPWLEEALAIHRRQGNKQHIARVRSIIASTQVLTCEDRFALDLELREVAELLRRHEQPLLEATTRWSLALLHHNAGDFDRAARHYRAAEDGYAALDYPLGTGIARAQLAALAAVDDRPGDAEALWATAEADLTASRWPHAAGLLAVSRGWEQLIKGDIMGTKALIEASSARGVAVEIRTLAAVLASGLTRRSNRGGGDLRVSETGDSFTLPTGRTVDMGRRGAARRLLLALARERQAHPGAVVGREALIDAGWPGEQIFPDAALARLYTTIRTLRRLGLDELLITREGGYLFSSDVTFSLTSSR